MLTHITKLVRFFGTPIVIDSNRETTLAKTPKQLEEGSCISEDGNEVQTLKCLNQLVEGKHPLRGIILGRRASGKSSIAKDMLLCHLQQSREACAIVFNGTERLYPVYGKEDEIKQRCSIANEYDRKMLESFLEKQKNVPENLIMVVFDNCFDMEAAVVKKSNF